jgi:hypothetical protein
MGARAVADSGIFRTGQQVWQRANIMAAANYLRELLARHPDDLRVKSLYEGLLEVLDPSRRTVRQQRELAQGTTPAKQERRRGAERRAGRDRRDVDSGPPGGQERRGGRDRRSGRDRRRGAR